MKGITVRSVVFKTKGKLDLRSITTFGLNAKPNSGHPIGYFGTGLKYAIAVLLKQAIFPVIYIDGKKWTFEVYESQFRDKLINEVYLVRNTFMPKKIKLPFTTDLGKNWKLWQAFRELYSNTIDEGGSTFVWSSDDPLQHDPGYTLIEIPGDEFVNEYQDREKTFLKDGLTLRDGSDSVQVFNAPSKHIYYRGIRIQDLPENEHSQLTYNILAPIELTEDRTAKSAWDIRYIIEGHIARSTDKEIIKKAVTAPAKSYERSFGYYGDAPSTTFLDVVDDEKHNATHNTQRVLKEHRPPDYSSDWREALLQAIDRGDSLKGWELIQLHKDEVQTFIKKGIEALQPDNKPDPTLQPDEEIPF